MPIQSLGIFDSVFDWVCDKILDPIIDWLGKILNTIFEWLLETIVLPILLPVFQFLWDVVIVNIADIFFTFIYGGYCQFLWILDQLQSGFDILIGLKDVTYYSESTGQKTQSTLLEYFMNNDITRNALLSITFIALALSIIFSIYSVMRSTLDFDSVPSCPGDFNSWSKACVYHSKADLFRNHRKRRVAKQVDSGNHVNGRGQRCYIYRPKCE